LHRPGHRSLLTAALVFALVTSCAGGQPIHRRQASSASPAPVGAATNVPVVVAAGDIACDPTDPSFDGGRGTKTACRQADTWALIRSIDPNAVLPLGDEQYDRGRLSAFRTSYATSWGRERWRSHPVPGNHEYESGGAGYFNYFGQKAGPKRRGWYSFNLGTWHLVALNSNCWVAGCAPGGAESRWLRHDLAAHPWTCQLATMHHPLFSSGPHGDDSAHARPLWRLLYRAGVDVVLTGHDHIYERFASLRPDGTRDPEHGFREFIVGTGGAQHYPIVAPHAFSRVRNATTFGVLALTLFSGSYRWRFVPVAGSTFTDGGTASCHGPPTH
jgi:acid phosphatase type 7